MFSIQQHDHAGTGKFFIEQNGLHIAELHYSQPDEQYLVLDYTSVDDHLRLQGIGRALVEEAVGFARAHGLKIVPLCLFVQAIFEQNANLHDVLAPEICYK